MKNMILVVVLVSFIVVISTVSLMIFVVGINVTVHTPTTSTSTTLSTSRTPFYETTLQAMNINGGSSDQVSFTVYNNATNVSITDVIVSGVGLKAVSGKCVSGCYSPLENGKNNFVYSFNVTLASGATYDCNIDFSNGQSAGLGMVAQ